MAWISSRVKSLSHKSNKSPTATFADGEEKQTDDNLAVPTTPNIDPGQFEDILAYQLPNVGGALVPAIYELETTTRCNCKQPPCKYHLAGSSYLNSWVLPPVNNVFLSNAQHKLLVDGYIRQSIHNIHNISDDENISNISNIINFIHNLYGSNNFRFNPMSINQVRVYHWDNAKRLYQYDSLSLSFIFLNSAISLHNIGSTCTSSNPKTSSHNEDVACTRSPRARSGSDCFACSDEYSLRLVDCCGVYNIALNIGAYKEQYFGLVGINKKVLSSPAGLIAVEKILAGVVDDFGPQTDGAGGGRVHNYINLEEIQDVIKPAIEEIGDEAKTMNWFDFVWYEHKTRQTEELIDQDELNASLKSFGKDLKDRAEIHGCNKMEYSLKSGCKTVQMRVQEWENFLDYKFEVVREKKTPQKKSSKMWHFHKRSDHKKSNKTKQSKEDEQDGIVSCTTGKLIGFHAAQHRLCMRVERSEHQGISEISEKLSEMNKSAAGVNGQNLNGKCRLSCWFETGRNLTNGQKGVVTLKANKIEIKHWDQFEYFPFYGLPNDFEFIVTKNETDQERDTIRSYIWDKIVARS